MRLILILIIMLAAAIAVQGQALEDWIESTDYPEELQEWLQELREHPLDLNRASSAEIAKLPFLNLSIARDIVRVRLHRDGLSSFSELDSLRSLDNAQLNSLHEFTYISEDYHALTRVSIRSSAAALQDTDSQFETSSASYRVRADFESSTATGFLFGLSRAGHVNGFEEIACGIELPQEDYRPRLLAGDYQLETGTGLLFATAYGMGSWLSSGDALTVPAARGLIARPSSSRLALQRGIASEMGFGFVAGRVFGAINQLDAQITDEETVKLTEGTSSSSELQNARKDQLQERLIGANIEFSIQDIELGATAYTAEFNPEFSDRDRMDPLPKFEDTSLQLGSLHARVNHGLLQAVSEFAGSSQGGLAHQSAVTYHERTASWSVYHIHADETFFSPHSRLWGGFGEDAGNANETGIRTMLRGNGYQLTLGGSTQKTPFRTSTSPLSKSGDEVKAQLRVYPGAQFEINTLINRRWAELTSNAEPSIARCTDRGRVELLIHGREEYKVRLEMKSAARSSGTRNALGTLAFFQMNTVLHGFRLYSRVALWNIEHSDVSMSLYEYSVYGAYPLVSLGETGRRVSVLLQRSWTPLKIGINIGHTSTESLNQSHETIDFALEISYRQ